VLLLDTAASELIRLTGERRPKAGRGCPSRFITCHSRSEILSRDGSTSIR